MEKKKNKFIYFIIFLIIWIIFSWIYSSIFLKSVDRNSYLELISWEWFLNNKVLEIWKREKLSKNDIIETKTSDSLAVIEWWDWSITRLWWNTKIEIKEQFVSKNKNNINIAFKLSSWKTWSNILSYLWEDSYFKQIFSDTEVAVRWTIYVVDMENDYLQVDSHKVSLKNPNFWEIEVTENKQLRLSDFKFISLDDFIRFFKDKWFFEINKKLDKEYFLKLTAELYNDLGDFVAYSSKKIDDLTKQQRESLYKDFLQKYQDLNFITPEYSKKLFDAKINLKEKLIELTPESWKWLIMDTLKYDLKNIFDSKNFQSFDKIIDILKVNEKYLDSKKMEEYFNIFNIKFEISETINRSIDIFKENVVNNPNYKKFFDSVTNQITDSINEQKNIFLKVFDWIKNLFN